MDRVRGRALTSLIVLAALACHTTITSAPPAPARAWITRYEATAAWELWETGKCLGYVVRYAESGHDERAFFNVSNRQHQVLGMIDAHNRTWRYRPHRAEPEWLGTGTVLDGARLVLGAGAESDLIEASLATLSPEARIPVERLPREKQNRASSSSSRKTP